MTQREKVESIINNLIPLQKEKIIKSLEYKNTDEGTKLKSLRLELKKLDSKIEKLEEELRSLQHLYQIVIEIFDNRAEKRVEKLELRLSMYQEIDTIKNSWNHYQGNEDFIELYTEAQDVIYKMYYSNFEIQDIKSYPK